MSNIYDVTLINKTTKDFVVTLKLLEEKGRIDVVKNQIELKEQSETKGKFVVTMDKGEIKHGKNKITIGIYGDGELIEKRTTIFMGPLL